MPKASVIVTCSARVDLLRFCLERLEESIPPDVEIVVVLNPIERSAARPALPGRARSLFFDGALGYAGAANAGAAATSGDLLVFVDYDLIVTPSWFEQLLETHCRSKAIGATGCRIADPHTGRVVDYGIAFSHFNCPHPHMDQSLQSRLTSTDRRVQAFCTAGCVIDRAVFEALGGFSSRFASLYTDIDFCLRLKAASFESWVSARAVAYHFGGELSTLSRSHRAPFLKTDVKAAFQAEHSARIDIDLLAYYRRSWEDLDLDVRPSRPYVACSIMSVVDADWYLNAAAEFLNIVDVVTLEATERDSDSLSLYQTLGYDLMTQRTPILYLVDRFVSLEFNELWWQKRGHAGDFVLDRHGNIMKVSTVIALRAKEAAGSN